MSEFAKDLIQSLAQAVDHAECKTNTTRVQVIEVPDVRAIRRHLRMSQNQFSITYRIPLSTLKN